MPDPTATDRARAQAIVESLSAPRVVQSNYHGPVRVAELRGDADHAERVIAAALAAARLDGVRVGLAAAHVVAETYSDWASHGDVAEEIAALDPAACLAGRQP